MPATAAIDNETLDHIVRTCGDRRGRSCGQQTSCYAAFGPCLFTAVHGQSGGFAPGVPPERPRRPVACYSRSLVPVQLTDKLLQSVKPPAAGRTELADAGCSGLVFRITAAGARSWSFRFRDAAGKQTRATIGEYPGVGLKAARGERASDAGSRRGWRKSGGGHARSTDRRGREDIRGARR